MNDFDYENLEKKRLARNAKYQKKGSRSKKCTLPDDFLTPAERKKLNGPVHTYNLGKAMTADEFRKMPPDLRRQYLIKLRDEYNVSSSAICKEMFERNENWITIFANQSAPELKGLFPRSRRPKPTKSERERWLAFIGKPDLDDGKAIKPYREDEPEPVIEPHPTDESKHFQTYKPTPEPTPTPVDPAPVAEEETPAIGMPELRTIISDILSELLSDYTIEIRIKRGGTT